MTSSAQPLKTCAHGALIDGCVFCAMGSLDDTDVVETINGLLMSKELSDSIVASWNAEVYFKQRNILISATNKISRFIKSTPNITACENCFEMIMLLNSAVEQCKALEKNKPETI